MSAETRKEFEKLLSAMAERALTDDEFSRLNALLLENSSWVEEYYDHCHIQALLEDQNGKLASSEDLSKLFNATEEELPQTKAQPHKIKEPVKFPSWLYSLAACIAIGFTIFMLTGKASQGNLAVLQSGINAGITTLDGRDVLPGDEMGEGTYELKKGIAELKYKGNIKVVIEGPASFKFVDDKEIFLNSGKVYAATPPGTKRFTISTPKAVFNDLGTEFAVEYFDEQDVRLFVFKGKVQAISEDGSEKLLTAGQGLRLESKSGKIKSLKVREDYFVTQLPDLKKPYQQLIAGYSPVVYLPMDKSGSNQFYNYSAFLPGTLKTTKGDVTKGKIGDAFRSKPNNYLEVGDYPKATDSLTVMTWLKIDEGGNGVVARNGDDKGQFKLYLDEGRLMAVMHDRHGSKVTVGTSTALATGVWHHVAFVFNGQNVKIYQNAKLVAAKRDNFEGVLTDTLLPGMYIGSGNSEDSFKGAVDEFAVFNKVILPDVIREIFTAAN
ncbi:MAG: FecR domain-containing protein [Lentisphaeraceae bacterium]|nr:FecR domain-containing protein [Lentisphaeraceae bacterium]